MAIVSRDIWSHGLSISKLLAMALCLKKTDEEQVAFLSSCDVDTEPWLDAKGRRQGFPPLFNYSFVWREHVHQKHPWVPGEQLTFALEGALRSQRKQCQRFHQGYLATNFTRKPVLQTGAPDFKDRVFTKPGGPNKETLSACIMGNEGSCVFGAQHRLKVRMFPPLLLQFWVFFLKKLLQ